MANKNKYTHASTLLADLNRENGRLIVNLAHDATGHVLVECDNFLRMKMLKEFDLKHTSFFFSPNDCKVSAVKNLFGDLIFDFWSINNNDAILAAMVANVHPELTVDIGISSLKMGVTGERRPYGHKDGCYYYYNEGYETYETHLTYIKRRQSTGDVYPLADHVEPSEEIEDFIGAKGGKVAVLHVRTEISSGNACPAQADKYDESLSYLRDCGYTIVFVGREQCPEEFTRFGVVNYANSKLASFENDFRMMKRAEFGVMSASGINIFLDVMGKPYLQLNSFLHVLPPFGRAVYVPALLREKTTKRELTFLEHLFQYHERLYSLAPSLEARHPSSQEIFDGVKEVVELATKPDQPMTQLQKQYRTIEFDPRFRSALGGLAANGGCIHHSRSRMSHRFLEQHQNLL